MQWAVADFVVQEVACGCPLVLLLQGKKKPNMSCKNNQPEGVLRVFHAPIANGFDHRVVFPPIPK